MLQSLLVSGHSIPDELVTKLILEKLKSSEVSHFGYIITEIPSLSQETMTFLKQIECIKNLELQPDVIINIKCADYDLCKRISGQRQHSSTGYIYSREQWDPEIIESRRKRKKDIPKDGKAEEEEEEEEQEEEEAYMAEMQMVTEILHYLVQRPEDYLENIENAVKLYKETLLKALEEVMAEHNPQYLIELDGNKSPEELFLTVIDRLKYLNLRRAAIVTKLQSTEEEINDIIDTVIDYAKLIQPRFDDAREKLIRDTVTEATNTAIKTVKDRMLLLEMQTREQAVAPGSQKFVSSDTADEEKTKSEDTVTEDTDKDVSIEDSVGEVNENHPEVLLLMEDTLRHAKELNFEQPYEKHAELLDEVIKEITEDNKNRFPGAPKQGGWIVDNCPILRDLWMAFIEKGIVPDLVISLTDGENNDVEEPDNEADEEVDGEDLEAHEEAEAPEMQEYTRGSLLPEGSEASEVPEAEHEPETEPFQYTAWELVAEDYDEEAEDFQAETEVDEEQEEEEEEEEEGEEKMREKKRHLGDTKHFCPVVLKENFILQPGNLEEAVKYRENIYYFSTPEAKEKFLEHPEEYVAQDEPLKAPPLRICLLGPRGSGKTICGRKLAESFGVFHIQFDEFLQEKMMLKAERKYGPEFEDDSEEEQATKQELEELAVQANVKIEEESIKKQLPDVQLTEEEEAIKLSLMENEALPSEILDSILSEWWLKEPIRSTGFILDGFPRYPDEAQFLGERGFFPDAVVIIQVEDQDIFDRLLPAQIQKWKLKQHKKSERKKLIKDLKTKIRSAFREDDDFSDEDADEEEDIENILEEEFPKDEEEMNEEDEEQEGEATERLRSELGEKFESDTIAKKLASEYGLKRLSIGDALRSILSNHPETELSLMINWHLHKGMTVPDTLALQALDISLMESVCNTIGVVIDGYPMTTNQKNLLEDRSIIPMIIFELDVPSKEIFKRLLLEKKTEQSTPFPLHNSSQIIAYKNSKYHKNVSEIRQFYQEQHQNWHVINGFHSKWWKFLMNPELYVPPLAPYPLPSTDMLPKRLTLSELKSRFPKCAELQGYCPVTYQDGKQRYEALVPGNIQYAVEYRERIYICETFNPKGSEYSRKKYKKKMETFVERCELITYLSSKMTRKYKEPQFRAIDFDHKLQAFFSLRNIDPITG
ncbi:Uncharacterized protein C6orf224 [Cricetulus griseus]|uniref:Uncharacterized protein C6orf224 n=1 Tax=Cricetulus griseus TaxID=10029 RepID=G3GXM1_CRIGR|nr:Uncharacterized protein C6orf224 [Cricetulus griseus]